MKISLQATGFPMNKVKKDLEISIVATTFFVLLIFWIIPNYVVVPQVHTEGQLSPAAYPTWICVTGLFISIIMTINALRAKLKETTKTKELPFKISNYYSLFTAFLSLFLFYFTLEIIGMFLGCFILYAIFAILCGERSWKRLIISDIILMIIMYVFFVKIAAVPIPTGILSSIL